MNIADIQKLTQALVEKYANSPRPVTVSHTSSTKGLTYTLKMKRTRPAWEPTTRGSAGFHTFIVAIGFDETCSITMTRKIVNPDSGELNSVEVDETITSLSDLVTHFTNWYELVTSIEAASEASRAQMAKSKKPASKPAVLGGSRQPEAEGETPATESPTKRPTSKKNSRVTSTTRTKAKTKIPVVEWPDTHWNASKQKPYRVIPTASIHVDDPRADRLDPIHYVRVGDWWCAKVAGEYSHDDRLAGIVPLDDPRRARSSDAIFAPLPALGEMTSSRSITPASPCLVPTIGMHEERSGPRRTKTCPGPRAD